MGGKNKQAQRTKNNARVGFQFLYILKTNVNNSTSLQVQDGVPKCWRQLYHNL